MFKKILKSILIMFISYALVAFVLWIAYLVASFFINHPPLLLILSIVVFLTFSVYIIYRDLN